jgi:hypothetical protein
MPKIYNKLHAAIRDEVKAKLGPLFCEYGFGNSANQQGVTRSFYFYVDPSLSESEIEELRIRIIQTMNSLQPLYDSLKEGTPDDYIVKIEIDIQPLFDREHRNFPPGPKGDARFQLALALYKEKGINPSFSFFSDTEQEMTIGIYSYDYEKFCSKHRCNVYMSKEHLMEAHLAEFEEIVKRFPEAEVLKVNLEHFEPIEFH